MCVVDYDESFTFDLRLLSSHAQLWIVEIGRGTSPKRTELTQVDKCWATVRPLHAEL